MKRLLPRITWFLLLYVLSYIALRWGFNQRWQQDGQDYVIFPQSPIVIYYIYRPLSWLDAKLTGQRFHIGPHR